MLCSVIVPLYNKENYIDVAIQSVLRQTWQEFEIVIIDDGSTDRSAEIVKAIADPRIRLIQQENKGVSHSRNRGIEMARGELIFFLDGDDWYDVNYLNTVVMMANQYPAGSFYATNFKYVLDYQSTEWDNAPHYPLNLAVLTDFYKIRFRSGTIFCTNSVAVRRADLVAHQPCFPEGESMGEDQDLWFRLAEHLNLIYCPLKLAAYRNNVRGSLCESVKTQTLLPVFIRLEKRATQGLLNEKLRSSALLLVAYERTSVARYLFSQGRRGKAFFELMKAFRTIAKKRWWATLLMCLFGSPALLHELEKRRDRRFNT